MPDIIHGMPDQCDQPASASYGQHPHPFGTGSGFAKPSASH